MVNAPPDIEDVTPRPPSSAPDGVMPESLDDLAREADMLDAAPAAAASAGAIAAAEQLEATAGAELFGVLQMVRGMVIPMLGVVVEAPRLAALESIWNDGVLERSAGAGAAIMARHGWTMGGVMGEYAPYIMLVAALAPPVIQTRQVLAAPPPKKAEPGPSPVAVAPGG
jgi:hypothetical protein